MKFFVDPLPLRAKFYILAVVLTGLPLIVVCLVQALQHPDLNWILLAAVAAWGSYFPVVIPLVKGEKESLSVTVSDVFIFAAILLYGPEIAVVVGLCEGVTTNFRAKIKHAYKQLFNANQLAVVAYIVGSGFYLFQGETAPLDPNQIQDVPLLMTKIGAAGLVYFLLNTSMVAVAISSVTRQPLMDLWKHNFVWASLTHVAGACLGGLVFIYFGRFELYGLAIASPIILLLYYAYKMNRERISRTQQHLDEVNQLLDKKIVAEKALKKAKEELETRVEERTNPHFSSPVYYVAAIIRPGCVSLGRPPRRTVQVRLRRPRSQALPGRHLRRLTTTGDEKCGLTSWQRRRNVSRLRCAVSEMV